MQHLTHIGGIVMPPSPRAGKRTGEGAKPRVKVGVDAFGQARDATPIEQSFKGAWKPTWWRLTLTLHQGVTVIRNLTERPDAANILECGWFETEPNGDEFAVGYDSIATVRVQGFSGPMTGSTS